LTIVGLLSKALPFVLSVATTGCLIHYEPERRLEVKDPQLVAVKNLQGAPVLDVGATRGAVNWRTPATRLADGAIEVDGRTFVEPDGTVPNVEPRPSFVPGDELRTEVCAYSPRGRCVNLLLVTPTSNVRLLRERDAAPRLIGGLEIALGVVVGFFSAALLTNHHTEDVVLGVGGIGAGAALVALGFVQIFAPAKNDHSLLPE
jgi:hypothetical protein